MADDTQMRLPCTFLSILSEWSDVIDLLIAFLWVCMFLTVALLIPQSTVLRIILGTPMLLFFPGYCLISFFWPAKSGVKNGGPDLWERIALSFALSIACVIGIMLILSFTQSGISMHSLLYSLSAVVLFFTISAAVRRSLLPRSERFCIEFPIWTHSAEEEKRERALFTAAVTLFIVTILILAYMFLTPTKGTYFTQFYYTDINGGADLPSEIGVGINGTVIIHIVCNESAPTNYTVIAFSSYPPANLTYVENWSEAFFLNSANATARNVSLSPGETFVEAFRFRATEPGSYALWWHLLINGEETDYFLTLKIEAT